MSPVVVAAIVAGRSRSGAKRARAGSVSTFCHPREGGDPVFHHRFKCLLDSRLRGNDKRGNVPAFPAKPIPRQRSAKLPEVCIARKRRYPAVSATAIERGAAYATRTAWPLVRRRNTSSMQTRTGRSSHPPLMPYETSPSKPIRLCDQNGISSSRSLSKLGLAPLLLSLRAPPLAGRRSLPVS